MRKKALKPFMIGMTRVPEGTCQKVLLCFKVLLLINGLTLHTFMEKEAGLQLIFFISCLIFQLLLWGRSMVKYTALKQHKYSNMNNLKLRMAGLKEQTLR